MTAPETTSPPDEPTPAQVRAAIANHELLPVFQPIYSLRDGRLLGVEALTRFTCPPGPSPMGWFMAAERAGLGADLELAALQAALEACTDLPVDVSLSVNASPATMCDPRLRILLAGVTRPVIVEITEHTPVLDYPALDRAIRALRAMGVKVAVDDAGTGASTVGHTLYVGPEVIKVDISLTQAVSTGTKQAMIASLLDAARITGAELVVEGVEDVEDLRAWIELGADAVQGYLVGRPSAIPAAQVSSLILDVLADTAPALVT